MTENLTMAQRLRAMADAAEAGNDRPWTALECGCVKDLAAMLAHSDTSHAYMTACHCLAYDESERCECDFCRRAVVFANFRRRAINTAANKRKALGLES